MRVTQGGSDDGSIREPIFNTSAIVEQLRVDPYRRKMLIFSVNEPCLVNSIIEKLKVIVARAGSSAAFPRPESIILQQSNMIDSQFTLLTSLQLFLNYVEEITRKNSIISTLKLSANFYQHVASMLMKMSDYPQEARKLYYLFRHLVHKESSCVTIDTAYFNEIYAKLRSSLSISQWFNLISILQMSSINLVSDQVHKIDLSKNIDFAGLTEVIICLEPRCRDRSLKEMLQCDNLSEIITTIKIIIDKNISRGELPGIITKSINALQSNMNLAQFSQSIIPSQETEDKLTNTIHQEFVTRIHEEDLLQQNIFRLLGNIGNIDQLSFLSEIRQTYSIYDIVSRLYVTYPEDKLDKNLSASYIKYNQIGIDEYSLMVPLMGVGSGKNAHQDIRKIVRAHLKKNKMLVVNLLVQFLEFNRIKLDDGNLKVLRSILNRLNNDYLLVIVRLQMIISFVEVGKRAECVLEILGYDVNDAMRMTDACISKVESLEPRARLDYLTICKQIYHETDEISMLETATVYSSRSVSAYQAPDQAAYSQPPSIGEYGEQLLAVPPEFMDSVKQEIKVLRGLEGVSDAEISKLCLPSELYELFVSHSGAVNLTENEEKKANMISLLGEIILLAYQHGMNNIGEMRNITSYSELLRTYEILSVFIRNGVITPRKDGSIQVEAQPKLPERLTDIAEQLNRAEITEHEISDDALKSISELNALIDSNLGNIEELEVEKEQIENKFSELNSELKELNEQLAQTTERYVKSIDDVYSQDQERRHMNMKGNVEVNSGASSEASKQLLALKDGLTRQRDSLEERVIQCRDEFVDICYRHVLASASEICGSMLNLIDEYGGYSWSENERSMHQLNITLNHKEMKRPDTLAQIEEREKLVSQFCILTKKRKQMTDIVTEFSLKRNELVALLMGQDPAYGNINLSIIIELAKKSSNLESLLTILLKLKNANFSLHSISDFITGDIFHGAFLQFLHFLEASGADFSTFNLVQLTNIWKTIPEEPDFNLLAHFKEDEEIPLSDIVNAIESSGKYLNEFCQAVNKIYRCQRDDGKPALPQLRHKQYVFVVLSLNTHHLNELTAVFIAMLTKQPELSEQFFMDDVSKRNNSIQLIQCYSQNRWHFSYDLARLIERSHSHNSKGALYQLTDYIEQMRTFNSHGVAAWLAMDNFWKEEKGGYLDVFGRWLGALSLAEYSNGQRSPLPQVGKAADRTTDGSVKDVGATDSSHLLLEYAKKDPHPAFSTLPAISQRATGHYFSLTKDQKIKLQLAQTELKGEYFHFVDAGTGKSLMIISNPDHHMSGQVIREVRIGYDETNQLDQCYHHFNSVLVRHFVSQRPYECYKAYLNNNGCVEGREDFMPILEECHAAEQNLLDALNSRPSFAHTNGSGIRLFEPAEFNGHHTEPEGSLPTMYCGSSVGGAV